ncbi:HNH endonuclease signature motif containing protein [Kribbella monticola]|uniref:HNH endonuclease signature motif containing protein n=1 Tax=Kribbella monticola TaxID=2185285 RepID=UPI0013006D97|nr:HNH endonuclease signature motif containing protein [Kribbella monticola]
MIANRLLNKELWHQKLSVAVSRLGVMEVEVPQRPCTMSGEQAVATLDALHAEMARLQTYSLEVVARLDDTGHTKDTTGQDTARFLSTRYRRNLPAVRRDLALARALPKYPTVTAALPNPYAPPGPNPTIQYTEPDATTAVEVNAEHTDESGRSEGDDGRVLPVLVYPEQAEAIVFGLEAIPTAAMVPVELLRAAEEQLVEAARHLTPADLKRLARQARDVLDTDGPEPAEEAAARRETLRLANADNGVKFSGFLTNDNAELFRTLIEAAAKPRKTPDGKPDPRPRDKRHADALTHVLTVAAGAGDLPAHGGVKPHVTVTIDYTDLKAAGRDATGDLQFGDGLSAAAVRRLACDAGIIPIVLGSKSEPLDVGREERYVTKAIRRALNRRDKGCVICGAPPRYCHAHHIVHWIDGGATSLENLALFCGTDHIAVHAGHYTVTIINGIPHVTRPTWADPPRTPPFIPGITRPLNPAPSHTQATTDTPDTTTQRPLTDSPPGAATPPRPPTSTNHPSTHAHPPAPPIRPMAKPQRARSPAPPTRPVAKPQRARSPAPPTRPVPNPQ